MTRYILFAILVPSLFVAGRDCSAQVDGVLGANENRGAAIRVSDHIYLASGFGNTFMIVTDDGNVIVDTSLRDTALKHQKLLREVSQAPIKYIVLTHAHEDHTGGAGLWKEADTQVVAQRGFVEMRSYQDRLGEFFARRNAAQFGFDVDKLLDAVRNPRPRVEPSVLFDEQHAFELGGQRFELYHTPGETYEHLTLWLPGEKAAFVGDNFYASFPNIYTLRGTRPRWALDYVASLNRVLELRPEILLPSHGDPIRGNAAITAALVRYRDAIQYVHDATVRGMNEGKDVYAVMRDVKLPAELDVGDAYGKVAWSVRGIYEGYVGWFDGNPATMYPDSPREAQRDLVELAGGADPVVRRARGALEAGDPVRALHLADAALAAVPGHTEALAAKADAYRKLQAACRNSNERGWLNYGLRTTQPAAAQ